MFLCPRCHTLSFIGCPIRFAMYKLICIESQCNLVDSMLERDSMWDTWNQMPLWLSNQWAWAGVSLLSLPHRFVRHCERHCDFLPSLAWIEVWHSQNLLVSRCLKGTLHVWLQLLSEQKLAVVLSVSRCISSNHPHSFAKAYFLKVHQTYTNVE